MKTIYIVGFYVLCILVIALLPINPEHSTANTTYFAGIRLDHLFHVLFFLPWMSFSFLFKYPTPRNLLLWFLAGLIFVTGAEGIQYFTPYRSFTGKDLLSNISGLILGCACLLFLKPVRKNSL